MTMRSTPASVQAQREDRECVALREVIDLLAEVDPRAVRRKDGRAAHTFGRLCDSVAAAAQWLKSQLGCDEQAHE